MLNNPNDAHHVRSLERDSGISDHGADDDQENAYAENSSDYDDIDCQQFENRLALSQDLRFLSGMPELCDVMFVVGEERVAMYGVKAILAIRSRVFYKMLYGPRASKSKMAHDAVSLAGNAATVGQIGRRLLGKVSGDDHRRNFLFLRNAANTLTSSNQGSTTGTGQKMVVQIEEFDSDVFKQLLEYVHTGSVTLRPRTLLGLLNAADHFALEELRRACAEYSQKCINLDTVCSLLVTAERYIQYKSSKIFVQRVLDFVDKNGDDVLQLTDFVHLPRHVVELILSRDELRASEMNKFQSALRWSKHFLLYNHNTTLIGVMEPFTQYMAFHSMTAQQLMHEIRPLDVVPDRILMNALAYQADPNSVNGDEMTRFNAGSACRRKSNAESIERDQNLVIAKKSMKILKINNSQINANRSRSVDRNVSKISNHSSNSDSGFHDDYSTYCQNSSLNSAKIMIENSTDKKKHVYRRHQRTPGATVVHVDSPDDHESDDRKLKDNVDFTKAKSCHDLTLLSNISSVHYRF